MKELGNVVVMQTLSKGFGLAGIRYVWLQQDGKRLAQLELTFLFTIPLIVFFFETDSVSH